MPTPKLTQAIILAAGSSSRFFPLIDAKFSTNDTTGNFPQHKSEISLLGKPIIYHTLDSLQALNLQEILVVVHKNNSSLKKLIEKYPRGNFQNVKVVVQENPLGMADALLSAQTHLADRFVVLNADHSDAHSRIQAMSEKHTDVVLCSQPTPTPELYGILSLKEDEKKKTWLATQLIEKPQTPVPNPYKIIGNYLLSRKFIEFMTTLPQEEYLLETALNAYMQKNPVEVVVTEGQNSSLKYPFHLFHLKNFLLEKALKALKSPQIDPQATISSTALIKGKVIIEAEAFIGDFAIIEGPAYIGKKAVVGRYSVVRGGSVLEAGAQAQSYADINRSILLPATSIHSGFIGDSILGQNCKIGAGFLTANKRFDRQNILIRIKGKKVDTQTNGCGVIMGHGVHVGIGAKTMPGVIIQSGSAIGPGEVVKKDVKE